MRAPPWSQLPIYGRVHTWAPLVTWLALLGFVVVAFLVPRVRFEYDFAALNRQDLPSVRIDREVNALMGHSQTPLAVSATQIRALLGAGRSVRFLVPDAVLNYIEAHHLYRAPH